MKTPFYFGLLLLVLISACESDCPCEGLPICWDAGHNGLDAVPTQGDTHTRPDIYVPPDLGRPDVVYLPDGDSPFPVVAGIGWPLPNAYSWDGSWRPSQDDFPLGGMLDEEYGDAHTLSNGAWDGPTPILPPGEWDWDNPSDDFANYRNFNSNIGSFEAMSDDVGNHFGWRFRRNESSGADYGIAGMYFHGSPGVDVLHLGPQGAIHTFTSGHLGAGPDVMIFDEAWSLDFFTGAADTGSFNDDDLVVAGCTPNTDDTLDIRGATIHTGPGADWIFARDVRGAAFDAGNRNGHTHELDPADGDDIVVLRGNQSDIRVYGGSGDDVIVWFMDESKLGSIAFQGANIFGGGGSGDAIWDTEGTDRLVLVIPPDTTQVPFGDNPPGTLMVGLYYGDDGTIWWDEPMYGDPLTEYCITCGRGPNQEQTVALAYQSSSGHFETGWFWITDIEELQLGLGDEARVFLVDQQNGTLQEAHDLTPYVPPADPSIYCGDW